MRNSAPPACAAQRPFHAVLAAGESIRRAGGARRRDGDRHPANDRSASCADRGGAALDGMSERRKARPATDVAHLGRDPKKHLGAINTPVYRASTMLFDRVADLESAERGEYPGISYGLHGLPTVTDLQSAVATLEGGYAALAVPSGLAAITLALLAVTRAGDHVLVTDSVYGPTRRFCENQLKGFGVDVSYYDPLIGSDIGRAFRSNTKVVFTESPGSLSFEIQDVPAIAEAAHQRGALVMLD